LPAVAESQSENQNPRSIMGLDRQAESTTF
jgi:hypothetical protein